MENKIFEASDSLHMDLACTNKIEASLIFKRKPHISPRYIAVTAACTILIMFLALSPVGANAVESVIHSLKNIFVKIPGTVIVENDYVYYYDGNLEVQQGKNISSSTISTFNRPIHLRENNGRLYLIGNLEKIDITDLISMDEPFIYIYEDDGITHYIAIGGEYNPQVGIDSVGYSEMLRITQEMKDGIEAGDLFAGWFGGYNANRYDPNTEQLAVWYCKYVVACNIPWENTEAQAILDSME